MELIKKLSGGLNKTCSYIKKAAWIFFLPAFSMQVQAVDIMPVGDSITQGFNACSYRTPLVQSFGNCNVTMVGSRNAPTDGGSLPSNCTSTNVDHEGHSGYSTGNFMDTVLFGGVSRIRFWVNLNTPDVVLLHIGSNDMTNGSGFFQVGSYNATSNTGTFTIGRIVEMIDEIYAENPNASIFVADLIPWLADSVIDARIGQLRAVTATMVADRASDGDDISLVNVSSGFQANMMQADNIHPNSDGETHIAMRFAAALHADNFCTPTPQIQSPATSNLQGSTQSFTWLLDNMNPDNVDNWELLAGSSANASDYAQIGGSGVAFQGTLTGLPTSGQTVHVTLRIQYFTGVWFTENRVYTASSGASCNGQAVTVYIANGDTPTSGADVIYGTAGIDVINGMGGNDVICALGGADIINAGRGNDWVDAGSGSDEVLGGTGDDTILGSSGDDDLFGGTGADTILGGPGNDTIYGNSGPDDIDGGDGIDEIRGGSGDDVIQTGSGATVGSGVIVDAGSGNDTITGGPDADEIRGSTDEDIIIGGGGNDRLFGGGGEDVISGQEGNDFIRGNAANDTLTGGPGDDNIDGGTSKDLIRGGEGADALSGSTGNDEIYGDTGNDTIVGGGGNDMLFGGGGNDVLQGGGSNDALDGGGGTGDDCDGESGIDTQVACETVTNIP